jgi:hypothetical protein
MVYSAYLALLSPENPPILLANSEALKFRLTQDPSESTEAWSNPWGNLGFVGGEIGSPTVSVGFWNTTLQDCCASALRT